MSNHSALRSYVYVNTCKVYLRNLVNTIYNVLFRYFVFASMYYSLLLFYKELWEWNCVNKDENWV